MTPGEDIALAGSAQGFSDACMALLRDSARRRSLGMVGRELVLRSYRWIEIRKEYIHALEDCLRGDGRASMFASSASAAGCSNEGTLVILFAPMRAASRVPTVDW